MGSEPSPIEEQERGHTRLCDRAGGRASKATGRGRRAHSVWGPEPGHLCPPAAASYPRTRQVQRTPPREGGLPAPGVCSCPEPGHCSRRSTCRPAQPRTSLGHRPGEGRPRARFSEGISQPGWWTCGELSQAIGFQLPRDWWRPHSKRTVGPAGPGPQSLSLLRQAPSVMACPPNRAEA